MNLLPLLEALAGDRVHTTTILEVMGALDGPARLVLGRAFSSYGLTLADALQHDPVYLEYAKRAPKPSRRELEKHLLRWAKRAGRDKSASQPRELPQGPLRTFVEEHGLEARLDDSVDVFQHLLSPHDYFYARRQGETLRALALRSRDTWPMVRAYLEYCVQRRATMERREALWSVRPSAPGLVGLAERLHASYRALAVREPPPPVRMTHVTEAIDVDELQLVLTDSSSFPTQRVAIALSAPDEAPLVRTHLLPNHPLIRVALERALDGVHDANDPLHPQLVAVIGQPRWERLLARLHEVVQDHTDEAPARAEHRVVMRCAIDPGGGVDVEPVLQKRTARGAYSKGRRIDFPELARSPVELDEHDRRVLAAAAPPPFHTLRSQDDHGRVLEALVGHPRVLVEDEPGRVVIRAPELVVQEDEGNLELALRVGDTVYAPFEALARMRGSCFATGDRERAEIEVARIDPAVRALLETVDRYRTPLPVAAADGLVALLTRLPSHLGLDLPPSIAGRACEPDSRPLVRAEPLPGGGLRAQVYVRPLGAGPRHRPGEGPTHVVAVIEGARVHTQRELAAERHAFDALLLAGLDAGVAESRHTIRFDGPDDALTFLEALAERPELATLEWPDDEPAWRVTSATRFDLGLRRAEHWFEADAHIDVDDAQVTLAGLLLALREGRRYVAVGKGKFARIADRLREQLAAIDPVVHVRGQVARIAPSAAAHVDAVLDPKHVDGDRAWKSLRERLRTSSTSKPTVPEGLQATLRDYQVEGIEWLFRTASWAEGACLADEMGLGKTLQALALLLARSTDAPALVVCPTSLSDNWRSECARFAPSLRPILYRGADRASLLDALKPGDLLIASYDVVARDRELLAGVHFGTLVLDEAQAIKNPAAIRTKAVAELRADFRLALTGTPIENRLAELYSLFSILAPGLLGPWDSFRTRFALPIEKHADGIRLAQLRDLVRPFLLRRTKALVARELPPRTEIVRPVELGDEERALYEAQRQRAIEMLSAKRKENDFRFALLAELTRLRRLVCHPRLVLEESTAPSSKLEELLALVDDLRREDHRALVFSQFTSLLAIVQKELRARRIDYLYLDGSTPAEERAVLVQRWQEGNAPLFLISLKAGGTGLNLTAADYVVHLDPWWNPAVEDQASDRAHRIGQTKPVTVVRLVAQGTIEERVLALHEEKRRLASGLLEGAEASAALDPDELLGLLSDGDASPTTKSEPPKRARKTAGRAGE
jgi:superfamily II DNA or RNA helicase